MKRDIDQQQYLIDAKKKAKRKWLFYIHLAGYIIFVSFILYNLYIVEGPYKDNIISLNLSIIVAWTVFIVIQGLCIFGGKLIFKKSWEKKKIEDFLNKNNDEDDETKLWE